MLSGSSRGAKKAATSPVGEAWDQYPGAHGVWPGPWGREGRSRRAEGIVLSTEATGQQAPIQGLGETPRK